MFYGLWSASPNSYVHSKADYTSCYFCNWPLRTALKQWLLGVQFSCSVVSDSATLWTAARQASLSIINSQSLLKLMSIESVMPSSHLILCHPLLRPPSIFPSIRVFSSESVLRIRWPKYWVTVGNWCINTGEKQTIQSRIWLHDFRTGHRKIYCIGILIFILVVGTWKTANANRGVSKLCLSA